MARRRPKPSPNHRPSAPSLRKKLLLLLGSVVFASITVEIGARFYLHGTVSREYLQQQVDRTWLGDFTQPSNDPELRYELKPGVDVNWHGVRVVTASDGSRRISSKPQAPSTGAAMRIAVLGDSSSFGWGVDYDDTYGAVLGREMEEHLGRPVEVRNFSVPGYNTQQSRVCFLKYVLPWKPDIVIQHHDFNDADPINAKPVNYMAPDYGDNVLGSMLIKWVLRTWNQHRIEREMLIAEDPAHPTVVYRNYRISGPFYDQHLRDLETIARESRNAQIQIFAFVFNPWIERRTDFEEDPFYTKLHQPIVAALQRYGYSVIDGYPLYQKAMAENNWDTPAPLWVVPPSDGHPSARGHALIARALFAQIIGAKQAALRRTGG